MPTIEELRSSLCAEHMSAIADTAATEFHVPHISTDGEQAKWDQLNRWVSEGNTLINARRPSATP